PVGRASQENLRPRCPRMSHLPRPHEAARHGHQTPERPSLPSQDRRADRCTRTLPEPRASLLEERHAAPQIAPPKQDVALSLRAPRAARPRAVPSTWAKIPRPSPRRHAYDPPATCSRPPTHTSRTPSLPRRHPETPLVLPTRSVPHEGWEELSPLC